MRYIFHKVWAIWGALFFVVTILIALLFMTPCFLLRDPAKISWFHKVSRVWMTVYLFGVGCPVTVLNKEQFEKGKNYIITCNHNSFFDIFSVTPFLPHPNKSIAKASLAKIPIFSWVYGFGSVLVDRNDAKSKVGSFHAMKKVLAQGIDMLIYPEGTRNTSNQPLKAFYNGAFRLAIDTQKPIMPVVIYNTRKILPANKGLYLSPHRIYVQVLPPIEVAGETFASLKEKTYQKMSDAYTAHAAKFA